MIVPQGFVPRLPSPIISTPRSSPFPTYHRSPRVHPWRRRRRRSRLSIIGARRRPPPVLFSAGLASFSEFSSRSSGELHHGLRFSSPSSASVAASSPPPPLRRPSNPSPLNPLRALLLSRSSRFAPDLKISVYALSLLEFVWICPSNSHFFFFIIPC